MATGNSQAILSTSYHLCKTVFDTSYSLTASIIAAILYGAPTDARLHNGDSLKKKKKKTAANYRFLRSPKWLLT